MAFFSFLFDFYLIFLRIFFTKITKKGKSYLQVMTWRARPGGELSWYAGPPCGCDAALRARGRAVGGPREAQEAHRAWPHGRGHASTRVHVGARVGRHVASRVCR